jgi:hypothetical protein
MRDYLKIWAEELLKRKPIRLKSRILVTGERNQHLGPRFEYAKIQISVEPSATFEVVDKIPANEELQKLGYLDWTIFGLLDILLTAESSPLSAIRVTLEKADYHAIDSSPTAFMHAGRDAGRKIIEAMKNL